MIYRPEGPTQANVPALQAFDFNDCDPAAIAAGNGCIGPPGLTLTTSKSLGEGHHIPRSRFGLRIKNLARNRKIAADH